MNKKYPTKKIAIARLRFLRAMAYEAPVPASDFDELIALEHYCGSEKRAAYYEANRDDMSLPTR